MKTAVFNKYSAIVTSNRYRMDLTQVPCTDSSLIGLTEAQYRHCMQVSVVHGWALAVNQSADSDS